MIPIISQIILKKLPDWNTRVFVLEDFYKICEKDGVVVLEQDIRSRGEYSVVDKRPIIVLRAGLNEQLKAWIAFHELGHHYLHYPAPHRFSRGTYRKMDREANFFASVALIPTSQLERLAWGEAEPEASGPEGLMRIRLAVYRHFGI
ncbi:MAG TPA: ImmA/IrrE family metallo-endopeptidase [Aridibacter sp.]|nr:ImmA/IrrE family metallo-endopeptidase [Aridibacter sp.]